jgi:hypothetical protein
MKGMSQPLEPFRCTCKGPRPTLVDLGNGRMVGLIALPEILEHFRSQGRASSPELAEELLAAIKVYNYVADSVTELYKAVLLREYEAYCTKHPLGAPTG